jgi:hypothetical protein
MWSEALLKANDGLLLHFNLTLGTHLHPPFFYIMAQLVDKLLVR